MHATFLLQAETWRRRRMLDVVLACWSAAMTAADAQRQALAAASALGAVATLRWSFQRWWVPKQYNCEKTFSVTLRSIPDACSAALLLDSTPWQPLAAHAATARCEGVAKASAQASESYGVSWRRQEHTPRHAFSP